MQEKRNGKKTVVAESAPARFFFRAFFEIFLACHEACEVFFKKRFFLLVLALAFAQKFPTTFFKNIFRNLATCSRRFMKRSSRAIRDRTATTCPRTGLVMRQKS